MGGHRLSELSGDPSSKKGPRDTVRPQRKRFAPRSLFRGEVIWLFSKLMSFFWTKGWKGHSKIRQQERRLGVEETEIPGILLILRPVCNVGPGDQNQEGGAILSVGRTC